MNLFPHSRTVQLHRAEPGSLVRVSWSGSAQWALVGSLEDGAAPQRALILLGNGGNLAPVWLAPEGQAAQRWVVSFGGGLHVIYDPLVGPLPPGTEGRPQHGLFVDSDGPFLRCAPPPNSFLDHHTDFSLVDGKVRQGRNGSEPSSIPHWSVVARDGNSGLAATLVSFGKGSNP